MEEKKEEKEEKISNETVVVETIPKVEARVGLGKDEKTEYNLITRDEALTEILRLVRELYRKV